jgi:hypothetical protein
MHPSAVTQRRLFRASRLTQYHHYLVCNQCAVPSRPRGRVDISLFLCLSARKFRLLLPSILGNLQHVDLLGSCDFPPTTLQQIVPGSIRPANWTRVWTRLPPRHRSLECCATIELVLFHGHINKQICKASHLLPSLAQWQLPCTRAKLQHLRLNMT